MASWKLRKPAPGEMVRVSRGKYFHFGICVAPEELIHFASPSGDGFDDPAAATVHRISLSAFAAGSFVECLELTRAQRSYTFTADETIARANRALGEKGYDVLKNNCQHFANRCLYGSDSGPTEPRRGFFASFKK